MKKHTGEVIVISGALLLLTVVLLTIAAINGGVDMMTFVGRRQ